MAIKARVAPTTQVVVKHEDGLPPAEKTTRTTITALAILRFCASGLGLIGLMLIVGFALLPLSVFILCIPLVASSETVLSDTQQRARTIFGDIGRRLFSLLSGITLLIALLAVSVQIVTWLNLSSRTFGQAAEFIFGKQLSLKLPNAMIDGWPYVLILMYLIDIGLIFAIGKVPLNYNLRNLRVRWITTAMTGFAFTVVVGLLTIMMGFLDSVSRLTANSGIPGNIFVLSEGATDEVFSNLGYGDVGKLELEKAFVDYRNDSERTMEKPVTIKTMPGTPGQPPIKLVSKETYFVINQESPAVPGKRRFVQLRGLEDAIVAGKVHNIELLKGEWFGREGSMALPDGSTGTPCVVGEGAAAAFADDYGREKMDVGDTFLLGDLKMVIVGIMKSAGSTFGSETWATNARMSKQFGKQSYTSVVMRIDDDKDESAQIMAAWLTKEFTTPRVRAVNELKYYEDLGKSNSQMVMMVTIVAIIMALGGIIGIMLVMFAAIAQRTKDIGVLRVLGFKRWQVLVSFMIESLAIALLGGLLGIMMLLGIEVIATALYGGLSITSTVSGGGGPGGKSVVTRLIFGPDVVVCGLLFTIVMGRIGGLLPSITAMRLGILDSLR
ncbi:ABC transporter permease [Zavarzinella formosa]|uniref:ABC transporter permease n=1 Tax=Zavarzinella formosa TaxID=360055 RepID=UPI0002F403C6|nr:FtsX-like permease family protein [Zavarzinella formosa]